jgi:glycosyltransferase involved in cell wall biosynthesis
VRHARAVPADLTRLAGVASLLAVVVRGQWVNSALLALVLLGLVLPRLLRVGRLSDLVYGVVLLLAAWSAVLDWYVRFGWLDIVMHVLTGGLTAALAHHLLVRWQVLPGPEVPVVRRARAGVVVTTTAAGTTLGLLWEVGEWFGHTYLDHRIQVGYTDTLSDLAADAVGALGAGLVVALRARSTGSPESGPPATGPSVSVVIPVRDDAVQLERCLELLARQSVPPLEVVVVDNGSTDRSVEVATRHGARVVPEPVRGIPAAAATGYDAARGEVIARCDADSRPPEDWVERIVRNLARDPALDAVTGRGRFYGLPRWLAPLVSRAYLGAYYLLVHAALGHTAVWGSNMALRRGAWEQVRDLVHRWDAEVHDDLDLSFALGPRCRVRYDRRLVVGVSARSLRGRRQLWRRLDRGFWTLRRNWEVLPPWTRWRTRIDLTPDALRRLVLRARVR